MKNRTSQISLQFDFGKNWEQFSQNALTPERVEEAKQDFASLFEGIELKDRTFLDIGFGQGLSLLTAASMGAEAAGIDIRPRCMDILEQNKKFFKHSPKHPVHAAAGSILDKNTLAQLTGKNNILYDIVHAWGVLHHTGDMKTALHNAASLVKPGGHLILAIYNRHWTSPFWMAIKRFYNAATVPMKKFMVFLFYGIIYAAKFIVTKSNPKNQARGMDFYYNVIDWIGGYPYEYASRDEVKYMTERMGFECMKSIPAQVPTGCNEFVFRKTQSDDKLPS